MKLINFYDWLICLLVDESMKLHAKKKKRVEKMIVALEKAEAELEETKFELDLKIEELKTHLD